MKKKLVRLTESDLHRIVENSVRRVIRESDDYNSDKAYEKYFNNESPYELDDEWKGWHDKMAGLNDKNIGKEGEEWLNTPEEDRNKKFPTIWPKKRKAGETDFNDLKNGSYRMQDYKRLSNIPYTFEHLKKWARKNGMDYNEDEVENLASYANRRKDAEYYFHLRPKYMKMRKAYESEFGVDDKFFSQEDTDLFGLYPTKRKMDDDFWYND